VAALEHVVDRPCNAADAPKAVAVVGPRHQVAGRVQVEDAPLAARQDLGVLCSLLLCVFVVLRAWLVFYEV
jgi:hypothetical protein